MTQAMTADPATGEGFTPAVAWTCPFCPLLCDAFHAAPTAAGDALALVGSDCPRAAAALARFGAQPADSRPHVDGRPCELNVAIDAAAQRLAASRQPLFGGLGTDVAGARALYRLACETGAIADAAHGAALRQALSALQDKGGFTTTLAEVRSRADLIVCVGGLPTVGYPEFFNRCGFGESQPAGRRIVVLGDGGHAGVVGTAGSSGDADDLDGGSDQRPLAGTLPSHIHGVAVERVAPDGDLFDCVARLAARVDGRGQAAAADAETPAAFDRLAASLHAASYAVIVWQAARLPAHGALVIEAIDRIVATLNRRSRAATLVLGGDDGGGTVNQVFTWLSGLPLRSRAGPLGLEHEPLRFDAGRLLAAGEVDALLWVASFGTEPPPPAGLAPAVVLGHPASAGRFAAAAGSVFIPVSTPGIGSVGHLFRTDGAVLMPLSPVYADTLPTVAEVVGRLTAAVQAAKQGAPAAAPAAMQESA